MTLMLLICTACQPTPEEKIGKNRGDKVLEQAANATAAPTYAPEEAYAAPERWEPNFLNREKSETMYAADWRQEHLEIFVSETGVHFFSWSHKKNVVNTANENVQLMSLEEKQDSIRKLISYSLKDADNTVLITHMILSTSIQQAANQGDEAFMVPTWVLFVITESAQKAFCAPGVLLINAIDGTPVW